MLDFSRRAVLVADIGGSNARFAVWSNGAMRNMKEYRCADHTSIESLIECYLEASDIVDEHGIGIPVTNAVIAVASVVDGDEIVFTNSQLRFSISAVSKRFQFEQFRVLNDFSALAMAIPLLEEDQLKRITDGEVKQDCAKGLIGAGTGLGVSGLLPASSGWTPIEGEGGHVRYGPVGKTETELFKIIANDGDYVSAESLLSGAGLLRLYMGMARLHGVDATHDSPASVVEHGISLRDSVCTDTLNLYCGMFGDVAGDLALTLSARGGIYIGGGVVNHMTDFFCNSDVFQQRFQNKGAKSQMVSAIPVFLITDTNAALVGAAVANHKNYRHVGICAPVNMEKAPSMAVS